MLTMVRYIATMLVFYWISSNFDKEKKGSKVVGKGLSIALYLLIFTMGSRIGANEEAMSGLASIGIQALVTTVMAIAGSMFIAFLGRKILGLNRKGLRKGDMEGRSESADAADNSGLKASAITLCDAAIGMAAGYYIVPRIFSDIDAYQNGAGILLDVFLSILLALVGYDLGLEGGLMKKIKSIGFRCLVLPICIMIGTMGMGFIYGLIGSLTMRESLAVFAGMGWYSLGSAIIMNAGHMTASAVSFLHNIFREVASLLFIPVMASKIGYYESIAMPAAPGMDCCLPTVKKYTNGEMVIYSLISGIITSFAVPVLVPLMIGA